ncbi:hypothetical protein LOK49_LG15G01699 [Camellia lanceoleosa]|uniref:Uncharacterized protein n=1 Tax=Camellia lanceoleosa TaxID=1840588 RepID=A0ACC0F7H7_9ERIC|nr:hypothetical protein LOK49_LG15G01699 [Camellia lanceoleosa]
MVVVDVIVLYFACMLFYIFLNYPKNNKIQKRKVYSILF